MMNIKRKYIRQIAITLFIAVVLTSCGDDFFDTPPGGRIYPDEHYNSFYDADLSYLGCFVYLQDIAERLILVDGLLSDQMDVTVNSDRDIIDLNRHEFTADNRYIDPSDFYKVIINVNEVLPNLPQILEKDRDFDSTFLFQYEGVLTTLRCWAYFQLARLNGEVGWIEGNLHEIDPSEPPVYLSKEQVIDRLINELLPYYDEEDIFRYDIDHYVLLGELYLEKNDYANAAKFLKFSVDGPAFRRVFMVDDDYEREAWQDIFYNAGDQGTTVRSAVPYSFANGQMNRLEEWMHYKYNYMVKPVDALIEEFEADILQNSDTSDVYRGMGVTYDTTATGIPYINKYSIDQGIPHSADVIIHRAADIHLMYAEALNRLGEHETALALVNQGISNMDDRPSGHAKWATNIGVRGRVYLQELTVPMGVPDEMLYIEDMIIRERAKELAFEGKRWFDLVRIANRRNDPAFLADKVAAKFEDPDDAEMIRTKLMDPTNWYLPIPKVGE